MNILLKIAAVTALAAASQQTLRAHSDVEIGPNGGRVLEFSTNGTVHGEVVEKNGMFCVTLLDKDMKPMPIAEQTLTATTGDRSKPEKLKVETKDGQFVVPIQKGGDHWTIFQFRETPKAKPVTARLRYIAQACAECGKPDWLCECAMKGKPKKK